MLQQCCSRWLQTSTWIRTSRRNLSPAYNTCIASFQLLTIDKREPVNKFSTSAVTCRRKKDGKPGPISSLPPSMSQHRGEVGGGEGNSKQNANPNPLALFKPVPVKPNPDDINFGEELAGLY